MPENATWDEQAQAYAVLLDNLGVHKVSVVAVSQGGPSALLFAVLYPERVSSLTLLSCGITPSVSENQAEAKPPRLQGHIMRPACWSCKKSVVPG